MSLFVVDDKTCNRDGVCAAVCPLGIIDFTHGSIPVPAEHAEELCIVCGHCVAVCPTGSLSHREMASDDVPPILSENMVNFEQCEQFLRSRRSIRVYRDTPVAKKTIQKLIELARYAPSGHNSQGAKWLVISDREELVRLASLVVEWMKWLQQKSPGFGRTLNLERAIGRWQDGEDIVLRGAPHLVVAYAETEDRMAPATCTIALTYLELAAPAIGLGCCWAGYFQAAASTFPPLAEALALPQGHQSYGGMMLGYPRFRYHRLVPRRPPDISWRP